MAILAELTSDEVLDTAYGWLCKRRRDYSADADVWSFRQGWAQEKDKLKAALAVGRFRFGLLTRVTLRYLVFHITRVPQISKGGALI
jgi:hypothetical protein